MIKVPPSTEIDETLRYIIITVNTRQIVQKMMEIRFIFITITYCVHYLYLNLLLRTDFFSETDILCPNYKKKVVSLYLKKNRIATYSNNFMSFSCSTLSKLWEKLRPLISSICISMSFSESYSFKIASSNFEGLFLTRIES